MLAAASVLAAAAALTPAGARDFDPAAHPATYAVETQSIAHAADHADEQAAPGAAKKWALLAAAAGVLAALVKLIGARRVAEVVSEGAVRTARAAATGAVVAVRAVGRAAASPLRTPAIIFGLGLFALAGVGLYDVEWIGGLVAGAALTGVLAWSLWKMRLALRPLRVKARRPAEIMVAETAACVRANGN